MVKSMRLGALHGVIAWTAYALVECCFSFVLPWAVESTYECVPVHVGFTVLLFAVYPAIGAVTGALLGLGLGTAVGRTAVAKVIEPTNLLPAATTFTVVAAFVVNLLVEKGAGATELPPLLMSAVITLALIASGGSRVWCRRLRFLTHPIVAALLLLGLPWINLNLLVDFQSVAAKAGVMLLCAAAVLTLSLGAQVIMGGRPPLGSEETARPARTLASLVAGAVLAVALGVFLQRVAVPPLPSTKPAQNGGDQPNVILITLDTVRADHLSPYGYRRDTTPNLEKFSEEATLYTRALAASDMTLSSHASIFTGMYPSRHGAHHVPSGFRGVPLASKFKTLAEILSEHGYMTMAVVANYVYLRRDRGLAQGFEHFDQRPRSNFLRRPYSFCISSSIRDALTRFTPPWRFAAEFRSAEEINAAAFRLLDHMQQNDARFFLFVNYLDAHWPYVSPPPFGSRDAPPPEAYDWNDFFALTREVMTLERPLGEEQRQRLESFYDLGLRYLDLHVGELVGHLKKLGLYDKSLIIITSDHGEAFGQRNLIEHGVSTYQDQVHVPLMIKYPYQSRGTVVSTLASGVDIMPTILDTLGYEAPSFVDGESLRNVDTGTSRAVISESFPGKFLLNCGSRFDRIERAISTGPFKFVSSTAGKKELYDLSKDPDEEHDVGEFHGETVRALNARLERWLEGLKAESRSSTTPNQAPPIGEADEERLRALGYIAP